MFFPLSIHVSVMCQSEELEMWFEGIVEGVKAFKRNNPDQTVDDIKPVSLIPSSHLTHISLPKPLAI